jgi:hypothetical protein
MWIGVVLFIALANLGCRSHCALLSSSSLISLCQTIFNTYHLFFTCFFVHYFMFGDLLHVPLGLLYYASINIDISDDRWQDSHHAHLRMNFFWQLDHTKWQVPELKMILPKKSGARRRWCRVQIRSVSTGIRGRWWRILWIPGELVRERVCGTYCVCVLLSLCTCFPQS